MKIYFQTNEFKSLVLAKYFVNKGQKIEVIDRKKKFSFDDSFSLGDEVFDTGYHAVDLNRSSIFTDILTHLDFEWSTTKSKRYLVFNNQLIERGYTKEKILDYFPEENLFDYSDKFLSNLESLYGSAFLKFSIEEIAPSYAQNRLWKKQCLSEKKLLTNIYPWFFPLNCDDQFSGIENHFHNDSSKDSYALYPSKNGFGFIAEFLRLDLSKYFKSTKDLPYETFSPGKNIELQTKSEDCITVWPIDYEEVARSFNLELPQHYSNTFNLVSIVLKEPLEFDGSEILVGDRDFLIDRMSSPDVLEGKEKVTRLQFECELEEDVDQESIIDNIKLFLQKFFNIADWEKLDFKKAKIIRYKEDNLVAKVEDIIKFLEKKNPNLIILNRNIKYENLSTGIPHLIQEIEGRI